MKFCVLVCVLVSLFSSGVRGAALDENFGYVDVRPGAHMFWVVYHTELAGDWSTHPLIMWLQGGPGASGVGYGNFQELGPYDINGNLRPGRWTQKANLMFVDNPVGTGYSYVDDLSLLTKNNTEIADDLVTLLISVFTDYPEMQLMPFFVYAESYGGKMTADFALALDRAIANGEITCNFQGIAMGDSWVSPMDSVNTWGTFLYQMGFVNKDGQAAIDQSAARTQAAVDNENWVLATNEWGITEGVVIQQTDGVDFYNVLAEDSSIYYFLGDAKLNEKYSYMEPGIRQLFFRHVLPFNKGTKDALDDFMNGPQAAAWNISDTVVWGGQSGDVFNALSGDFMKPVVTSVSELLTNSKIHVAVYTGDLDLICDTPGTYMWIENMAYPQKIDFESTMRQSLQVSIYPNNAGYVQRFERFSLFTILRSGHMVPIDAPEMCLNMIDMITQYGAETVVPKAKPQTHHKLNVVRSKVAEAKVAHSEEHQKEEHVKEVVNQKKEEVKQVVVQKVEEKKSANEVVNQNKEHVKAAVKQQKVKATVNEKAEEVVKANPPHYQKVEIDSEIRNLLKNKVFQRRHHVDAAKANRVNQKQT